MQFAMLVYETASEFETRTADKSSPYIAAWRDYHKTLAASGAYIGGNPLKPPATAATVRLRGGERRVHDGPFAETREVLGGFFMMELPSLEAAIDWASRCPAAATGSVEVRPLAPEMKETIVA